MITTAKYLKHHHLSKLFSVVGLLLFLRLDPQKRTHFLLLSSSSHKHTNGVFSCARVLARDDGGMGGTTEGRKKEKEERRCEG
jgi:hypothetical protein